MEFLVVLASAHAAENLSPHLLYPSDAARTLSVLRGVQALVQRLAFQGQSASLASFWLTSDSTNLSIIPSGATNVKFGSTGATGSVHLREVFIVPRSASGLVRRFPCFVPYRIPCDQAMWTPPDDRSAQGCHASALVRRRQSHL